MFQFRKTIGLLLLASFSLFTLHCSDEEKGDDDLLNLAIILLVAKGLSEDSASGKYLDIINAGHEAWEIGLATSRTAGTRNLGDAYTLPNPKNWITVTDSSCNAGGKRDPGLTDGIYSSCVFAAQPNVVGVCYSAAYSTGEIVWTTILLRQSYLDNDYSGYQRKKVVAAHEVGHCLGLVHHADNSHVMYAYVTENDPHSLELSAVSEAYNPMGNPAAWTFNEYYPVYTQPDSSKNARRQFTFPTFHISAAAVGGSSSGIKALVGPGDPVTGPITVTEYRIHADGSTRVIKHETGRL